MLLLLRQLLLLQCPPYTLLCLVSAGSPTVVYRCDHGAGCRSTPYHQARRPVRSRHSRYEWRHYWTIAAE